MLPEDEVRALMEAGEAEVDLEALEVRFDGRAVPFEIDDELRHRLLNGLDDIALDPPAGRRDRDLRGRARAVPSRPGHDRAVIVRAAHRSLPRDDPTIVTLPGDGIGPEILAAALRVLDAVAPDFDLRGARRSAARASTRTAPR